MNITNMGRKKGKKERKKRTKERKKKNEDTRIE
jgi:hypothetical protein